MQPIKYSSNPSNLLYTSEAFCQEELFSEESPKINHLKLQILGQQRTISPWFNFPQSGHHNLLKAQCDRSEQRQTRRRSGHSIPTIPQIVKPTEMQHELYRLNRTLVQFRVKPSKNRPNKRIEPKIEQSKLFLTLNKKQEKQKNKQTISYFSAAKTPKIQFLKRKMKIKESFLSNNRRVSKDNPSFAVTRAEWIKRQSLSQRRNSLASEKVSRVKWVQNNEKIQQFQSCYEL